MISYLQPKLLISGWVGGSISNRKRAGPVRWSHGDWFRARVGYPDDPYPLPNLADYKIIQFEQNRYQLVSKSILLPLFQADICIVFLASWNRCSSPRLRLWLDLGIWHLRPRIWLWLED
ncbi:unnamed protein product [Lactuca virosa]|uniref:Uncharacterized protein n=1 Tax=Lactuca virosa TaxID=75947 RepID=A0AAU9LZU3_9ASTR|nr:unnamed protein product [Lactuca virosa]